MQSTLLQIVGQLGCSVMFVTHDIREAILLGDRVLLMSHRPGHILDAFDVGTPKPRAADFQHSDAFAALYRADPRQNSRHLGTRNDQRTPQRVTHFS